MCTRKSLGILVIVFSFFVLDKRMSSQSVATVQIAGSVQDTSGASVPDAVITATQTLTGLKRSAVSGAEGLYIIPQLPVGPYQLTVEKSGFKTYIQRGIDLQVGDDPQIKVTLAIGEVSERVEVNADTVMVQTTQTSASTLIDQRRIVDLPLNGRQATQLIILAGAAAPSGNGGAVGSKNYPSAVSLAVGGGNFINYLMDGADNEDVFTNVNQPFPFPDALQEFSVETSVTSATHGLHPGATVNVVTKSGTNHFHGDLFEFIRNGDFQRSQLLRSHPRHLASESIRRNDRRPSFERQAFLFRRISGHTKSTDSSGIDRICANCRHAGGRFYGVWWRPF